MVFECYFRNEIKNKQKITLVLGSGFHKYRNNNESILTSWKPLLESIVANNFDFTGNYLIDFERIILNHDDNLTAKEVENGLLKTISGNIKRYQENLCLENYPTFLFNPDYVSDVIVLNFDEVAEKVCMNIEGNKMTKGYIKIDATKGVDAQIHQSTRYNEVTFNNGSSIRFWHPHGSVSKYETLILGHRKYSLHIANVERFRKHYKHENIPSKNQTWFHKLIEQPVLILGAGISDNEIDLWTAFVNRERNFAKQENKKYRKPIYQMRESNSENISAQKWFQPLFDETIPYENQWELLEQLFNQ